MKKAKVLLVAQNGLNRGGIQAVIMSIVRNLYNEFTFDIVVFNSDKREYEDEFLSYGGNIYRRPHDSNHSSVINRASFYFRYRCDKRWFKQLIQKNGPYKAVHCNNGYESCVALSAAKDCGVPVRIVQTHVISLMSQRFIRRCFDHIYKSSMLKCATNKLGCSEEACVSFFGASEDFQVIPNPYNEMIFDSSNYPYKRFFCPDLIQVGNYSDLKNQLFTLEVFKCLKEKYREAELCFVGFDVGGYKGRIQSKIEEYGFSKCVTLYPSDADIPDLLSKSSYLILPSRTEAFGIVLIEAQAMGLTCFASDVVPQVSDVGGCRYLSIREDPAVWAQAIIEDFEKTNGKHHMYDCSRFRSSSVAQQYADLYVAK